MQISVEEEIQEILTRYVVTVEMDLAATEEHEVFLTCQASRKTSEDVLLALTMRIAAKDKADLDLLETDDVQAKYISLAVVAVAKMIQIQEESLTGLFSGDVAEA